MNGLGLQSVLAVFLVLGLLGALAWAVRRGAFASLQQRGPVTIETAVPLGERRSLIVVAVEGRRLLLGLTPAQVSFVTELQSPATATRSVSAGSDPHDGRFDREVAARI
jgi:flagellar protein FliO/FliZ